MYRELLAKQNQASGERRHGRVKTSERIDEGNDTLKRQYDDMKVMASDFETAEITEADTRRKYSSTGQTAVQTQGHSPSTLSPAPEKQSHRTPYASGGEYTIASATNIRRHDLSKSPVPRKAHIINTGSAMNHSVQQLSNVEKVNLKQLNSISQLQTRMQKTQKSQSDRKLSGQYASTNDYLQQEHGLNGNQYVPQLGQKRVKISEKSQLAFQSTKVFGQSNVTRSTVNRSILKPHGSAAMLAANSTIGTTLPTTDRFRTSKSTFKTPIKSSHGSAKMAKKTKTPGASVKATKRNSVQGLLTEEQSNLDLPLDTVTLSNASQKQTTLQHSTSRIAKSNSSLMATPQINNETIVSAGYEVNLMDEPVSALQKNAMLAKLNFEALSGSESRYVNKRNYQTEVDDVDSEMADTSGLNSEQRNLMSNQIDKLDLQGAIRQKARNYFAKEKLKTAQQTTHDQEAQFDLARMILQEQNLKVIEGEQFVDSDDDTADQELLKNVYTERQVASQSAIRQKLRSMIQSKEEESRQLGQMQRLMLNKTDFGGGGTFDSQQLHHKQTDLDLKESKIFDDKLGIMSTSYKQSHPETSTHGLSKQKGHLNQQSFQASMSHLSGGHRDGNNQHPNNSGSLPKIKRNKESPYKSHEQSRFNSESRFSKNDIQESHLQNLYASQSKPKDKMARSMYQSRKAKVEPRYRLSSFKRDYCPIILGQYRFGLSQKNPQSTDPDASAVQRFSQLPCYRFAESNKPFMKLFDEKVMEYRKTRRFLSQEICRSPEGKRAAKAIHNESPVHNSMVKKIQLKLLDEEAEEHLARGFALANTSDFTKKSVLGLKGIQEHNKNMKNQLQIAAEVCSSPDSAGSSQSILRMKLLKGEAFDKLLEVNSERTISGHPGLNILQLAQNQQKSQQSKQTNSKSRSSIKQASSNSQLKQSKVLDTDGLDVHTDFVGDVSQRDRSRLKKAMYEMDQVVADRLFKTDAQKMALSLYYDEHAQEKMRDFKRQQRQLINCLNILFGGETKSVDYINMAKNLTKKLKRQVTDDQIVEDMTERIVQDQTADLDIDEANINTEIISMLAEEILQKTEFFSLFKGSVRDNKQLAKQSKLKQIKSYEDGATNEQLLQSGNQAFLARVQTQMESGVQQPQVTKSMSKAQTEAPSDRKRKLTYHEPQMQKNPLSQVVETDNHYEQSLMEKTMHERELAQQEMAKASFITQCEKSMVVTLPLLLKISNKKMILERYQMNNGLCQALRIAFAQFKDIVNDFHLDNNNLTDDDFSVMLDGMSQLTYVNRLSYMHNDFGIKSLQALQPIICKTQPKYALKSLHLKHCKMSAKISFELLHTLNQHKNFIKSLSLVNVNLNQSNYKELCQLIRSQRHLQDLDISWNGLRCHQMFELIDVIVENRSLQDLNLSYNNMHDSMQEKFAEATPAMKIKSEALKAKLALKAKRAKTQAAKQAVEIEQLGSSMQYVLKIVKFIKMNNNLMHLNLSGMGMTTQMMTEFGRAMRRTKSMVSLHLSQNNGDNERLRAFLVERAHIKIFEPIFRPDFKQLRNLEYKNQLQGGDLQKRFKLENSIIMGGQNDQDQVAQGKSKISEQLNLKNMLKNKRGSVNRQNVESDPQEMLIFNRYLGHKTEMPGSGQWRMISTANDEQERCWVCNLEVYSLVFWSRDFGIKQQQQLFKTGIDEMAYENQLFELEQRNAKLGIKVDFNESMNNPQLHGNGHNLIGFPQIYTESNNWKPQRMYTIEEFCYIMDSTKPDIIKNLKRGNFIRDSVKEVSEMNADEKAYYDERMNGLLGKYSKMKNWRKLLGSTLKYKRPFLANAEALLLGHSDVNIAKMDEELYPSDSDTDEDSATDSDKQSDFEGGVAGSHDSYEEYQQFQDIMRSSNFGSSKETDYRNFVMGSKGTNKAKFQRIREKNKMNRQLYVMPCFLKPGKQTFVVQSLMYQQDLIANKAKSIKDLMEGDRNQSSALEQKHDSVQTRSIESVDMSEQFFFHQTVAPQRRERVPLHVKQLATKEVDEKPFDRNQTCFKDWKPPTDKDLARMIEHDREFWKLPRFIKEEAKLNAVISTFQKNIRSLFYLFITLSASSSFPGITWLDFGRFSETCNFLGGEVVRSSIDRYFLASAGEMAQQGCYRYQFFEAVMRVAETKYLKAKQPPETQAQGTFVNTSAEALNMLLKKNCFALGPIKEWQDFREKIWWNYDNHAVIMANQFNIQKMYKSYFAPRKKYLTKLDAIEMMTKHAKVIPDENKVIYCYGMSKMHVIQETSQKHVYDEMKYVEFLEFLGRCAYAKYAGPGYEDYEMVDKLKLFLDELMPTFGMTRKEVELEEEELSESDPDY